MASAPQEGAAALAPRHGHATAHLLVTGLQGGAGSTIGPDGALYVTEGVAGRITRVDPRTGATTTYASGLPRRIIGVGGAMDIAFLGRTAYVLVTLVGPDVGGSDVVGIYRVDGPNSFTVVADIGAFALAHPPATPFDVPTGLQYALQPYRGGFLVTDGHHNRVLWVTRDGQVTVLRAFGNIVPTGLEVRGGTIYMAEAGPVPHLPENGKVVAFRPRSTTVRDVASGSPLLVDVEFGRRHRLYALSQGIFGGGPAGSPALPSTGALVKVNRDGTFTVVIGGLNQPTSLEFIGKTGYVVTLGGEIWKIKGVWGPPQPRIGVSNGPAAGAGKGNRTLTALGKLPLTAPNRRILQLGGYGHRPCLSVDDRCRPMRRARRGHGRRGRRSSKRSGDGYQLGRRVRPVFGDHLPRWQGPQGQRQPLGLQP